MAIWDKEPAQPQAPPAANPAPPRPAAPTGSAPLFDPAKAPKERSEMKESIIASGLSIEGKIIGSGHVRVAGKFKGDVQVEGNLHIDSGARVEGQVRASEVIVSGELHLLQRGNKGDGRSACVRFDWNQLVPWLTGRQPVPPRPKSVLVMELGQVDGVPLGFTDGAALPGGGWVFSAVAEATQDSYHDGACAGSAIGVVGPDGAFRQLVGLQGAPKVEGIAVLLQGDVLRLSLVTDADDPAVASQLLQAHLALV